MSGAAGREAPYAILLKTSRRLINNHAQSTQTDDDHFMKETLDKYVYYFGDGSADGDGTMKPLLGGKGANLAEMTRIGLPVPPGFTITTEVCTYFYEQVGVFW